MPESNTTNMSPNNMGATSANSTIAFPLRFRLRKVTGRFEFICSPPTGTEYILLFELEI